ncbi:MAG: mannose-1-phosphate guanylyltransferase [Candidatus Paceibacteria bacterium]
MNTIIFAGGTGRRLWPLSRQSSPKQFQVFKGEKSTLQMAVDRVEDFGLGDVYISTNENFTGQIKEQVPELPQENILAEPAKRDLAAAVGLSLLRLKRRGEEGIVAVLWADHFMKKPDNFKQALEHAEKLIDQDSERFVFLAETPGFANENLGWIRLGENIKDNEYKFRGWEYKPNKPLCQRMYESGEWMWNPGYFVFDLDYCLDLYQQHQPEMYEKLQDMIGDEQKLQREYEQLKQDSFDSAIVEKIDNDQAVVLKVDLGWRDPGTLYALKEALTERKEDNLKRGEGEVVVKHTKDSLVYNEEEDKLAATLGLEGTVVVNTEDVLFVCSKEKIKKIKPLLKELDQEGLSDYL